MFLRSFAITLFSTLLALTSVTLVVARHGTVGTSEVILCSAGALQVVVLDATGQPVSPAHPCPDCVAAIAAQDVPIAFPWPLPPLSWRSHSADLGDLRADGRVSAAARARGPPLADVI